MTDDTDKPVSKLPTVLVDEDTGHFLGQNLDGLRVSLSMACSSVYADGVVLSCDPYSLRHE